MNQVAAQAAECCELAGALNALGNVFGKNVANIRRTRFVALAVGIVGMLILSAIAFTPLVSFLMSSILKVPEEERPMVRTVLQVLAIYPVLKSICMISQGHLIRGGRSYEVLWSRVIRLVVGLVIIVAGYELEVLQGGVLGATAILGSLAAQTIYLWWKSTQVRAATLATSSSSGCSSIAARTCVLLHQT